MQRGIPEWDITEEYPAGARVQYNDVTYVSLTGTSNVGQQPDTATTFWERWAYSDTEMQPRVDKITTFAVTTADVTLTAEQAKAGILNVTGTLTGNRNIIIPNTARRLIVINGTSGAFTLGVKTASGVAINVGQGSASSIVCDGNNNIKLASADLTAYAPIASPTFTGNPAGPTPAQFDNDLSLATTEFVQRALGSYSGATNYGVNTTLTAADTGKATYVSAAVTITMPAASAIPAGGVIEIIAGVNGVVVQRAGADTYFGVSSSTSITLNLGDSVKFRSNGTSVWLATAGTMRDFLSAEFTTQVAARFTGSNQSLAASGYQKLPGGLIMQWGIASVANDGSTTVTLPIAFPNSALMALVSLNSGLIATAEGSESYNNLTTTQVTLRNGTNSTRDMSYLAFGY